MTREQAGVKQLLLHRLSRRYHPKDVLAEAKASLPNTAVVNDFDRVRITKEKPVVADNLRHGRRKQ